MRDHNQYSADALVVPLTHRESEILTLLAQGHSGPEIAEQLTLALSSVRWHLHQLYGKLGVNTRQRAILRAEELGLLPAHSPAASGRDPSPKHNLPLQITRFFGREKEIVRVKARLAEHRLVTLIGPGGVGKTRLALQAAEELVAQFADGIWLVELAALSDPSLIPQQVAAGLGLRDEPGRPLVETLVSFLRKRQVLLVIDNCEHLLAGSAHLANDFLRTCPQLRLLVTSRQAMGIAGEAVFPVPSLPYPDPRESAQPETLLENVALRLFADRARLVLPEHKMAAEDAVAIARICRRLDGIPLAIEMAAARVNLLTAGQIADRLDDVFRLLTGGSRTALPRQQTLQATIDWSYDLLNIPERLLLQRLSVFAGGGSLDAVETICADPTTSDPPRRGSPDSQLLLPAEVLGVLGSLVAKSMVVAVRRPGETRYHLLEMVRQYGLEKLAEAGTAARVRDRHSDYYSNFVEKHAHNQRSAGQLAALKKLATVRDNVRLALEWALSEPGGATKAAAGPQFVVYMYEFWPTHKEELDWLQRGIAWCQGHADAPPALYAELLGMASNFVSRNDPPKGLEWGKQAVEISRGLGLGKNKTHVFNLLFLSLRYMGVGEAEQAAEPLTEAETLLQELGTAHFPGNEHGWVAAYLAYIRAAIANAQGRYPAAKRHADESLQFYESIGNASDGWVSQLEFGSACLESGEFDQARDHFLTALNLATGIPEVMGDSARSVSLRWLALLAIRQGDLRAAQRFYRQSLQLADSISDHYLLATGLGLAAIVAGRLQNATRAAALSGAAQVLYARQGRKPWEDSSLESLLPGWRERPDQDSIMSAFETGLTMSVDEAIDLVLNEDTMDEER